MGTIGYNWRRAVRVAITTAVVCSVLAVAASLLGGNELPIGYCTGLVAAVYLAAVALRASLRWWDGGPLDFAGRLA